MKVIKAYIWQYQTYTIETRLVKNMFWRWYTTVYQYPNMRDEPERRMIYCSGSNSILAKTVFKEIREYLDESRKEALARDESADGQYSHVNSKGVRYYLNMKEVTLRAGKKQPIYYFSRDVRPEATGLPSYFRVNENPRNGFLSVIRIDNDSRDSEHNG